MTDTYTYYSFGNLTASSGTTTNTRLYTGREYDANANLYYYRARYYDPTIGRFISEDPIQFGGGKNFYLYVGNNPIVFTDPSGLKHLICHLPPIGPNSKKPTPITKCASGTLVGCLIVTEGHGQGDPDAISPKGAKGLMQTTPIAIEEVYRRGLFEEGMTLDDVGHTYLNLLLGYCDSPIYAIAAYNAGTTAVNSAGGIPNITETRNYVRDIDRCLVKQNVKGGLNNPNVSTCCP